MYTLNSGNCPVVKVSIGMHTRRFLVDTGAAVSIFKPETIPYKLRNPIDHEHAVVMKAVNGSTFKSEGSINLHFKLWNRYFRHGIYTCSIINGDGLPGTDFLGKHQTRILLDKDKLILSGIDTCS